MPESANGENVRITEKDGIEKTSLPKPARRSTVPKTNGENETLQHTSSASESSSYEERQEASNVNSSEPLYASIDRSKKTSKKSSDSREGNPSLSRSPSQETVYSEPWNSQKTSETLEKLMKAHPTPPPSYQTDGSEKSLLRDNKKTNRFLQKVKYTMQKKKVTMPFVGLITACCITSIVLAVKQREFIGFIGSINPVTIFVGLLASCLALGIMWELMQAVRTKEHKITKRDTQEVLDEISNTLSKDEECIKSLVLKHSNGNRVYFTFHSLPEEAKNNPNIVELTRQPIYYKSKVNSLINYRIWLPILGTVLITGNITFPLALYSTGGLSNIVSSYTNPTIYWPIVAISGTLLLFTLACSINHWSKTDFKDYMLLHKQDTNSENPNETAIKTVKSSQEKINSKLLQVVAERCGHPDITYIIN
ncbi:hypothetical protein JSQ73_002355 [Wolbachia endosymbiont of Anopheles demeilloni]|uniref:hypothetical protein n=1 Tax=Wolbachia endosymbiont of Anopheles demeilloni TaxID=2748871 RepID=UPI001BDB0D6C|nr:hypothetical protein [Wolbachia endosymbiont of Anopheles demeilloni]UIP93171.1 hypothetical protein JSQ73_002355 [Wolbachia endosymbiont of Anopheles demeilloni]